MPEIFLTVCSVLIFCELIFAQNTFKALVKDAETKESLVGVSVLLEKTTIGTFTDSVGFANLTNIPNGQQTITFSFVGYEQTKKILTFPLKEKVFEILLEHGEEKVEEVFVTATRTSRTIENTPVRVEVLTEEEISEKIAMIPSNISMILSESTGIQVQQTSATSANSSIKIQGLDGKYTQILKDGFPLFGGFSGGLSLMQVPPLDLQQVEIIKGSSSTLYGGDAIAGIVNLVSKQPSEERQFSVLLNQTSAKGSDFASFYSKKGEKLGLTFLANVSLQTPYDANNDDFSDLPKTQRITLNPKLFYFGEKITSSFGISTTFENREGGDIFVLKNKADSTHVFFEKNHSERLATQFSFEKQLEKSTKLVFKNSFNTFDRKLEIPSHTFEGTQLSSYSEVSFLASKEKHDLVFGLNFLTDKFNEKSTLQRDYKHFTTGFFVQDDWFLTEKFSLKTGLRTDYHSEFNFFVLPGISGIYKFTQNFSARFGVGSGYKIPTIFNEKSEELEFQGVTLAKNSDAETSKGGNFDFDYKTVLFDDFPLTINQIFYFTQLDKPLVLDSLEFTNSKKELRTKGFETNVKISYEDLKFFTGYTYLQTKQTLTPKHKLGLILVYEKHGKGRIGYEAYYTSTQKLFDGTKTEDFWVMGLMAEKRFGMFSFFVNFENFSDTKQKKIVLSKTPYESPVFEELWKPTEGFIFNGGVKINF